MDYGQGLQKVDQMLSNPMITGLVEGLKPKLKRERDPEVVARMEARLREQNLKRFLEKPKPKPPEEKVRILTDAEWLIFEELHRQGLTWAAIHRRTIKFIEKWNKKHPNQKMQPYSSPSTLYSAYCTWRKNAKRAALANYP
jgi:hypothetical protein